MLTFDIVFQVFLTIFIKVKRLKVLANKILTTKTLSVRIGVPGSTTSRDKVAKDSWREG